jgi:TonB family protein
MSRAETAPGRRRRRPGGVRQGASQLPATARQRALPGLAGADDVAPRFEPATLGSTASIARVGARTTAHAGGSRGVAPPQKMIDVKPNYPDEARAAKAKGVVLLEVTIAADGSVSNALVLRSIPMLDQAAIDALMQWKFQPTWLNGAPVEVEMLVLSTSYCRADGRITRTAEQSNGFRCSEVWQRRLSAAATYSSCFRVFVVAFLRVLCSNVTVHVHRLWRQQYLERTAGVSECRLVRRQGCHTGDEGLHLHRS